MECKRPFLRLKRRNGECEAPSPKTAEIPTKCNKTLAHRNRSDFYDLRLGCPSRTQEIASILETRQSNAALQCDLRSRWKIASDLRFRSAISEPRTHSFCRNSGDLAPSTRKSLAIAIVRFWCAKPRTLSRECWGEFLSSTPSSSAPPGQRP